MPNLSSRIPQGTLRFISRRLIRALISLLIFQTILFGLIQALPSDLVELKAIVGAHGEGLEEFQMTGPAEPIWQQFITWVKGFYQGDLGKSTSEGKPVADVLVERLPRSLLLLLPGTVIGFLLGVWLGKRVAWQKRGWLQFVATLGGTAFYTSFPPWLAFVMIHAFGLSLGWFPAGTTIDPMKWFRYEDITINEVILKLFLTIGAAGLAYLLITWLTRNRTRLCSRLQTVGGVGIIILAVIPWITSDYGTLAFDLLYHLMLPMVTLILLSFGETMLVMRATMVEAMQADHVPVARAKGLRDSEVRDRHVARVAILPVLARFILRLPLVVIGSFVLENVFTWDGMGEMLFNAAQVNDLAVLMGVLTVVGVGILLSHIFLDLINLWIDPRQREAMATEEFRG
jgi:peptide/nickel transport system permease protein